MSVHWSCPFCANVMTLTTAGSKYITHSCSRCGGSMAINYVVKFYPPSGDPDVKAGIRDGVRDMLVAETEVTQCPD